MRRRIFEVFDSDKLFRIKHGKGLLDFSVTDGTGLLWIFPDGTTSTASRPAKTVTAGETLLYCDNWSVATLQLSEGGADAKYLGDLSDLPALTYTLILYNCANITGDLSDLPALTYTLDLYNCANITGDLSDLPALTYTLSLYNCANITGDLSDLPALTNYLSLYNCANITGDLSDLPALTHTLNLYNCTNVTGVYSAVNGNNVPTTTHLSYTGMSAADMDNTLIAYAACTKNNGSFTATDMTRTAASDDAVTALSGRGWSISGITKE